MRARKRGNRERDRERRGSLSRSYIQADFIWLVFWLLEIYRRYRFALRASRTR